MNLASFSTRPKTCHVYGNDFIKKIARKTYPPPKALTKIRSFLCLPKERLKYASFAFTLQIRIALFRLSGNMLLSFRKTKSSLRKNINLEFHLGFVR